MKVRNMLKKRELLTGIFSAITVALILGLFYWRCGVYFETNDERYMIHILSGSMTGRPDPHVVYMNYILGVIFSSLYTLTTQVPWLGLFLIACYYISYVCIMYCLVMKGRNIIEICAYWVTGILFVCMNLYIFCELQFTTIAGVLAITGYFLLVQDRKKNIGLFFVFEVLAIFVRDQSMMLVQPMGFAILACVILKDIWTKHKDVKSGIIDMAKYAGVLCGVFVMAFIGNYVIGDYGSTEWKEYAAYNDLNTDLFDYYGRHYDEKIAEILQKHNVTEADYQCFINDWMCMSEIDNKCLIEIRDYVQSNYEIQRQSSMGTALKNTLLECYGKNPSGYSLPAYDVFLTCSLLFVSVLLILKKKYHYFLWMIVIEVTKFVLMFYLVFKGRYPLRVTSILMFAELLFLLFIVQQTGMILGGKVWKKVVLLGCTVLLLKDVLHREIFVYWDVRKSHIAKSEYTASINELFDYWNKDECGYLLDTGIVMFYTGEVLDTKWHGRQSFLWCGGWFYNSPTMYEAEERYLEQYDHELKTIVRVYDGKIDMHVLDRLRECGIEYKLSDTVQLTNGEKYNVYMLKRVN